MCENIRADGNMGKDRKNVESRHIRMAMDLHRDTPDYILRSRNYAEKGASITICRYIIY